MIKIVDGFGVELVVGQEKCISCWVTETWEDLSPGRAGAESWKAARGSHPPWDRGWLWGAAFERGTSCELGFYSRGGRLALCHLPSCHPGFGQVAGGLPPCSAHLWPTAV